MPPKKKAGRSSNNKKNKAKGSTPLAASANATAAASDPISCLPDLSTFRHDDHLSRAEASSSTGGYYEVYKQATTRFWNWMKDALPDLKMTAVNDLKEGADRALQHNIDLLDRRRRELDDPRVPVVPVVTPVAVLEDLSTSIRLRQKVTDGRFGTGRADEGHKYMVDVLRYCRDVLKAARTVARVAALEEQETNEEGQEEKKSRNEIGGWFSALALDDDDADLPEIEKQMESDIRERKFPSFPAPEKLKEDIDIEQVLIDGDDRFQAIALLHSMNDLMHAVENHYALLKHVLRGQDHMHYASQSKIQLLMECAVAANMATQSIHIADSALAILHPHISSFYHVLALVYIPQVVADMEKLMTPKKFKEEPHVALDFVADILECSFHNKWENQITSIVKRYHKKTGIAFKLVEDEAEKVHLVTRFEVQLSIEERLNQHQNQSLFTQTGVKPHSWLQNFPSIGGDRCILNTLCIVQKVMDLVQDKTKLEGRPGFWGPELDETNGLASSIRGGLDETFGAYVLPELIEICRSAPFYHLPDRRQLITVLDLLERHIKGGDRKRPVTAALTFGLHAILTSIFVLQGDGDLARIATYAKQSYQKLFRQLECLSDPSNPPENSPKFYANVNMFKQLVNFSEPVQTKDKRLKVDPGKAEQLAFWNPLIGGEYMLYGTYICSIRLGSATVDSLGQLRFALHLYNALLQQREGSFPEIRILSALDKMFANTRAVWVGGRPEKGSYGKSFWMAWGVSATAAANYKQSSNKKRTDLLRDLDEIRPAEFSMSYRRLVKQDFTDEDGVADIRLKNATKEGKTSHSGLFDLLTKVNLTRDAMDEDEDFVTSANFSVVGCILLEFVNAFSIHRGWDAIIQEEMKDYPDFMRHGKTMKGNMMTPGGFTASDVNIRQQRLAHFWGDFLSQLDRDQQDAELDKAIDFMFNFFQQIHKESYTFFVENDEQLLATRRTPRDGSYPYGRTGQTPQDPLPGFCHLKYSKSGAQLVRLICPGKHTPFVVSPHGHTVTPYEERGNKMPRERSGKYRHIASYKLDELIALGWDGATYTSTRGKHAAIGHHVPFIVGYDSDPDDEYEPIDIEAGKREGVVGLPADQNGLYMTIPGMGKAGRPELMRIKNSR